MRGAHAELAEDVKKRVSTLWEDQPDLVAYGVGQSWGKSEETVEWKAGNCEVLVRIRYR